MISKNLTADDLYELVVKKESKNFAKNLRNNINKLKSRILYYSYVYDSEHGIVLDENLLIADFLSEVIILDHYFVFLERIVKNQIHYLLDDLDNLKYISIFYHIDKKEDKAMLYHINHVESPIVNSEIFFNNARKVMDIYKTDGKNEFNYNLIVFVNTFRKNIQRVVRSTFVNKVPKHNYNKEFLIEFFKANEDLYFKGMDIKL